MSAERLFIDSSVAPGARLRLHRATAGRPPGQAGRAVLFVHGATYPGTMYDVPGASWLEQAAADGHDAYALDKRGYGGSSRPACMAEDPQAAAPFCRAADVLHDLVDAITAIQAMSHVARVDIVAWSWGTLTSGLLASRRGDLIDRLVLFAPIYATANPLWQKELADREAPARCRPLGAYRTETRAQAATRWASQITAESSSAWRDPAILNAWFDAMLADEPGDAVRAPNGVLLDLWDAFAGTPCYAAEAITAPTLVIRGTADPTATRADALLLFDALGTLDKRYIEIAQASHFLLLEHRRTVLHAEVAAFLNGALAL